MGCQEVSESFLPALAYAVTDGTQRAGGPGAAVDLPHALKVLC